MDHQKIKKLLFPYLEEELSEKEKESVEEHLKRCPECRQELEKIKKLEEIMGKMKLKNPPKEAWQMYWLSVYNRLERKIGWILLSVGGIFLLFFGGYQAVEGIIKDPSLPLVLKVGILLFMAGIAIMVVSLIREQFFVRKKERYKEVQK